MQDQAVRNTKSMADRLAERTAGTSTKSAVMHSLRVLLFK